MSNHPTPATPAPQMRDGCAVFSFPQDRVMRPAPTAPGGEGGPVVLSLSGQVMVFDSYAALRAAILVEAAPLIRAETETLYAAPLAEAKTQLDRASGHITRLAAHAQRLDAQLTQALAERNTWAAITLAAALAAVVVFGWGL